MVAASIRYFLQSVDPYWMSEHYAKDGDGCLGQMLALLPTMRCGKTLDKKIECPICRKECRVQRGEAMSLPMNYTALGA